MEHKPMSEDKMVKALSDGFFMAKEHKEKMSDEDVMQGALLALASAAGYTIQAGPSTTLFQIPLGKAQCTVMVHLDDSESRSTQLLEAIKSWMDKNSGSVRIF